jgi:hypothetical protein
LSVNHGEAGLEPGPGEAVHLLEEHEMTAARITAAVAALTATLATGASAQTQPRAPNMPNPNTVPAEKMAPDLGTTGSTGETLSERLNRTEGVIKPPTTATPDMTVPAPVPNPGTTPVIPPPGTSPTDPIQPK